MILVALGEAASTHLAALERIPCVGSRCVSFPCLALPRLPGGLGVPQPLQPLVSADGEWGCQLAGAPASFCSEDSCLSETSESRAWFHPAAFNNASALLSCTKFQPATSFRKALHLHYLPLEPSGPPT